eukprot:TRINITY_DN25954_c0_g1_i4.p1 TRINITY_DN25954_c0_g1~~TRINITY_DN25954_c0_g1_i4.p1  ORF type:complete len:184 (+),score=17.47 TRINITY_DN25954_c0_g1_i4:93-644(+)
MSQVALDTRKPVGSGNGRPTVSSLAPGTRRRAPSATEFKRASGQVTQLQKARAVPDHQGHVVKSAHSRETREAICPGSEADSTPTFALLSSSEPSSLLRNAASSKQVRRAASAAPCKAANASMPRHLHAVCPAVQQRNRQHRTPSSAAQIHEVQAANHSAMAILMTSPRLLLKGSLVVLRSCP